LRILQAIEQVEREGGGGPGLRARRANA
jgi:hypothetical protein